MSVYDYVPDCRNCGACCRHHSKIVVAADDPNLGYLLENDLAQADAAVGTWVTHKRKHHSPNGFYAGVDEAILSKRIKRYVFVGNTGTHGGKEMLRYCRPVEYRFDWLVSRSMERAQNMIWVFDFNN